MKEGKTLLLTTHFMEESDALSDRIMIISNGVIKADGTSAKLKEDYGSGKIYPGFFLFNRLQLSFRL
jgi:ABC-type multidrug transport system ATPase subunit